jgi:DNA-binding response OmpR family regulator
MPATVEKLPATGTAPEVIAVLVVSDRDADVRDLRSILRQQCWRVTVCPSCVEALGSAGSAGSSVILCDRNLRDGSWKRVFLQTREMDRPPLFVVASRYADEHLWAEVLNLGGYDVLLKPFEAKEVTRVLSMAWRNWSANTATAILSSAPGFSDK